MLEFCILHMLVGCYGWTCRPIGIVNFGTLDFISAERGVRGSWGSILPARAELGRA